MKSKNLAVIATLVALCSLTACGTGTNNTTTDGTNETTNNTTTTAETNNNTNNMLGSNVYKYENGTYRGSYVDNDVNQVSVEFVIKDNKFESIKYRALYYKDNNYLDENATGVISEVKKQYEEAAGHLVGKEISAVNDLYKPADIVKDMDTVTGATLRSNKLVSAIWDGLNRHPYKLAE